VPIGTQMGLSAEDAAHLLRRVGFGPTAADIDALAGLSTAAAVDAVLDVSGAPAVVAPPEAQVASKADWWDRYVALLHWWTDRMRTTPCPIQEKMTLFWHGHFCSSIDKVDNFPAMFNQNVTLRQMGMGSFRALTQAVAIDPAMLAYLDNADNVTENPNENWARESMELFTLGVDQYTQDDVVAAARAWTGHTVDETGTQYVFNAKWHDSGSKTFFGITRNWDGPDIIDEILTGSKQPIAAQFIATKLWSFLAYPDPEPAVVQGITSDFLASDDLDITALLRSILNRPEFWSPPARAGLVRTPTEFVVAAMRYTGLAAADAHPDWYMSSMGQQLFNPPNVAGWRQNDYWISSAAFWARAGFARDLTWSVDKPTGVLPTVGKMTPAAGVQAAFDRFGITQPSTATRAALEQWFASQAKPDYSWSLQPDLITLVLLSPDFQVNQ
jgi:uncharacterized protein (DUF1800 family)